MEEASGGRIPGLNERTVMVNVGGRIGGWTFVRASGQRFDLHFLLFGGTDRVEVKLKQRIRPL